MTVSKTLLAAGTAALVSVPAWALPGPALSHPTSKPNNLTNPGTGHRSPTATEVLEDHAQKGNDESSGSQGPSKPGHPESSHKCKPHKVGYVASGTLESWSLTPNSDGTFSGSVTVLLKHANHHAAGDLTAPPTPKEYKLEKVHLTFGLADTNGDGSVGVDDLAKGDSVHLIGKITALAKKCSHTGFTATTTIRHVVFHAPSPS